MKKLILLPFFLLLCSLSYGQSAIGTTTPHASAALDLTSTTRGLLVPRMTKAQRNAIPSPAVGLLIYNTEQNCIEFRRNDGWYNVCTGALNP